VRAPKPWIWLFTSVVGARMLPVAGRRAVKKLRGKPNHLQRSAPRPIPKTIWIYWDRGEAEAPELVRHCIASWRERNPGWDVRVLDMTTAAQAVDMPQGPSDIPVQSYADLLRLRLLRRHGGVWVDATAYCIAPLDGWLPPLAQRGFFAFMWTRNDSWFIWPGMRRTLTNWFIASEPEGGIVSSWEAASFDYWQGRKTPHTYYWPHVMIDYLCLTNRTFRRLFADIPRIGCYGAHLVHDCVTHGHDPDDIAALLAIGATPVQKLRWNWSEERAELAKQLLGIEEGRGAAQPDRVQAF
jgi:hypothetical protein